MPDPYRPSFGGRLRYIAGGRLPRQVEWVRHDLTDAGWPWRVGRHAFYPLLPVIVVAALLPLPGIGLHVLMVLLVVGAWGLTIPPFVPQLRDRRLRQHGLPVAPEDGPHRTYG